MGQVKSATPEVFDYSKLVNGVEVCMVMAVSQNGVIGKENGLPWNFPEDLARFKDITSGEGKALLMGYNTWLSLPVGKKSGEKLAGRKKFVLTTKAEDLEPLKDTIFLRHWRGQHLSQMASLGISQLLVIGGAFTYRRMLALCDRAYITVIKENYDGDIKFPLGDIDVEMHLLTTESLGDSGKLEFRTYIDHKYVRHIPKVRNIWETASTTSTGIRW